MTTKHPLALRALLGALTLAVCLSAHADVRLARIFGSHMVLQCDRELPVWGWAEAGEKVEVQLGTGPAVAATADAAGQWRVTLPAQPAGGPVTLTATGKSRVALDDVLIGEVWLCSGQSNMEMAVASCLDAEKEIAGADFPQIRQIKLPRRPLGLPATDFEADWQVCSPATAGSFTAAGYFMARELQRELKVPIGLVNASWGGTAIEPWTPPEGFARVPALATIGERVALADPRAEAHKAALRDYLTRLDDWRAQAAEALAGEKLLEAVPAFPDAIRPPLTPGQPAMLYNGMIHPLIPFALRGAIWYQGEANRWDGKLYTEKTKALVGGWRELWKQGDFPFYYVQIAPYQYGNEDPYVLPAFWEAQAAAQAIPNTGMVVTNDIGDVKDIHPKNKQEVGRRLALLALAGTYGRKGLVCNGPTFKSLAIEGNRLRVRFDNVGGGLASRDGKPLTHFEIIGKDTDFVPAEATIDGDAVLLSATAVAEPVAARYAWHRNAEPNLMNKEGLPGTPFRAGEVPVRDYLALNVFEAKDYRLVYDLDLAKLGPDFRYDVDNHTGLAGPFDRVAYFLELQKTGEPVRYLYVSLDAFTDDVTKIGIPTVASKARFQQKVKNMNVISNAPGIVPGTALATGNIEFWPSNYGAPNSTGIPNASSEVWDFGDQLSGQDEGYGSMQVHNHGTKQTLFAINNWRSGARADIGIGNSESKNPDWTFVGNAGSYSLKRLRVLVRPK